MYMQFIKSKFTPTEEELEILDSELCRNHFNEVQNVGGFIDYYSSEREFPQQLLSVFQKYLLNYEKQSTKYNGIYLQKAYRIAPTDYSRCKSLPYRYWAQNQVIVWAIPPSTLQKLNQNSFTLDAIVKNHGDQQIDILEQREIDSFNFTLQTSRKSHRLSIQEYVTYVKNPAKFYQTNKTFNKNFLLFGVNVDLEEWDSELKKLYQYVPQSIFKENGLDYLRSEIYGVTIPQLYIKAEGVWTGGHQENGAINAFNLNHGPHNCIWYTVDAKYVPYLLQKQPNILKFEGLWYRILALKKKQYQQQFIIYIYLSCLASYFRI